MNKFVTNALNIKAGKAIVVSNKKLKELRAKAINNISRNVNSHFDFEVGGTALLLSFLSDRLNFKPEDKILEFNFYYFTNKLYSNYFRSFDVDEMENNWSTLSSSLFPFLIRSIYDEIRSTNETFDSYQVIFNNLNYKFKGPDINDFYRENIFIMNYKIELQRKSYFYIKNKAEDIADFIINMGYMLRNMKFQNQLTFVNKYISAFLNILESDLDLDFGIHGLKAEIINGKRVIETSCKVYEIGDGYEIKLNYKNGLDLYKMVSDHGSLDYKIFHFPKEKRPDLVTWAKDFNAVIKRPDKGFYDIEIKHNGEILDFGKTEAKVNYLVPYLYYIPLSVIRKLKDKDNKVIELRMVVKRNDYEETYEVLEDSYITIDLNLLFNKLEEFRELVNKSKNINNPNNISLRNMNYENMFKELSEAYDTSCYSEDSMITKIFKILNNAISLTKIDSRKKDEINTHVEKLGQLSQKYGEICNYLEVGHMNKELFETMFISIDKLYDILTPQKSEKEKIKDKITDKINKIYEAIVLINNLI